LRLREVYRGTLGLRVAGRKVVGLREARRGPLRLREARRGALWLREVGRKAVGLREAIRGALRLREAGGGFLRLREAGGLAEGCLSRQRENDAGRELIVSLGTYPHPGQRVGQLPQLLAVQGHGLVAVEAPAHEDGHLGLLVDGHRRPATGTAVIIIIIIIISIKRSSREVGPPAVRLEGMADGRRLRGILHRHEGDGWRPKAREQQGKPCSRCRTA